MGPPPTTTRREPIIVPMPDGTIYEVHPMGYVHRDGIRKPRHRIYRRTSKQLAARHAGRPIFASPLRRVLDEGEMARVAARLVEMQTEAKRDIQREKVVGTRLHRLWQRAMVFIDILRAWWRARRK